MNDSTDVFTDTEIYRTTRLAGEYGFESFDSGRADNVPYEDTCFFELQTFMGVVDCGAARGAARSRYRRGKNYGPHSDTRLRTVKRFSRDTLVDGFDDAIKRTLSAIASRTSFPRPVTAAIDITTVPCYGEVEAMPMVSGAKHPDQYAYEYATIALVGRNVPLVLAVEPVRENSNGNGSGTISGAFGESGRLAANWRAAAVPTPLFQTRGLSIVVSRRSARVSTFPQIRTLIGGFVLCRIV